MDKELPLSSEYCEHLDHENRPIYIGLFNGAKPPNPYLIVKLNRYNPQPERRH